MEGRFDVIILGYGPVGAVLASVLGQEGLSVAVLDRMEGIHDKPRAINIDHEVMRLLQSVGLAGDVEPITIHHTGTEFRGLHGRLIKQFRPVPPPYLLGWAPNLMFIQPEFEPILRRGVARHANVDVMLGVEAVGLEQDEKEVRVPVAAGAVEPGAGGQRVVRGRYLVACDGAASPVRKRLGVEQDSLDFDEWWTVVDAWVSDAAEVPKVTTQYCDPSGPTTYVVGPRGLRRWELKLLPHEDPASYADPSVLRRRLAPFVDTGSIDIWRAATYRFHALVARDWRCGRVMLAGDAAHQMPPFMAQGLCSGLRDAANLGWKLARVVRAESPDTLLDTYAAERKPHLRQLVETTKELGLVIGELDPGAAAERDERLAGEVASGRSETVRQNLVPNLTAGLLARDAAGAPLPPAGLLSPQPFVTCRAAGCRLLDDVVGRRFLLLALGPGPQAWVGCEAGEAWRRLGGVRLVLAEPGSDCADGLVETGTMLRDWMARHRCRAILVRPDKYVFGGTSDPGHLNRQMLEVARGVLQPERSQAWDA